MFRRIVSALILAALVGVTASEAEARHRQPVRGAVRGVGSKVKAVLAKVLPPYRDRGGCQ